MAVAFGMAWVTVLALPRPVYDPGCQPSYEGLVPGSCAVKSATTAATAAKPGARRPRWPTWQPLWPLWRPPVPPRSLERPWKLYKPAEQMEVLRYWVCVSSFIFRMSGLIS